MTFVEIRAAEGGADSRDLIDVLAKTYLRRSTALG